MLEIFKYLTSGVILTLSAILYAKMILKEQIKSPFIIILISIIFVSFTYYIIYKYFEGLLRSITNTIIITVLFIYIYKINIAKSIFLSFIHSVLLMISDLITLIVLVYILDINMESISISIAGTIIINIFVCSIFLLMTYVLKKAITTIMKYKITTNKKILIFTILTIICLFIFFYQAIANVEAFKKLIIYIFLSVIFLLMLFDSMKQKRQNEKISDEYDTLIEFVKDYEQAIDNQRIYQHENKNQLINIKSKIVDKEKNNKIVEYIDSILNEDITFNKQKYSKFKYLPSNGLKGLLYYKVSKAEKVNISVDVNISSSIEKSILYKLNINDYKELCRIIGVYLDNAIEASTISQNKNMGIEFYQNNNQVKIIISNTYEGILEASKIDTAGYSTKGKGRGYGLSLVNNIVRNNSLFSVENEIRPNLYIQTLIIGDQ